MGLSGPAGAGDGGRRPASAGRSSSGCLPMRRACYVCDVDDAALHCLQQAPSREPARPRPTSRTRPTSTACSTTCRRALGGLDALINNAGIAGPTGGGRGYRPGRLAALHRHRPDRPVPVRAARRADAQGRRRRRHRQHVVGRRPVRLRLPHTLLRRQMGRHRLDRRASPRSSAPPTSASTPSCPASSKARA